MEPLLLQMEPAPHQVTHQHVSPAQLHPPPTCLALGRCPSVLPQPAAGAGVGVGVGQASGSRLTRSQGHGPCIGPRPGGSSPLHLPLSASTVPAPPALCSSLRILPAWGWPGRPWPFASAALSLLSAGNALPRLAPRQHPPVQVRTTRPCFRTCRMERPRGDGRRARPTGPGSERMRLPWS